MKKNRHHLLPMLAGALAITCIARAEVEKPDLKLGFIKLTDCAPLVIAKEKGYFEDEGLFVTLEAQANWKILLDRVLSGELDGAHMLAGQPIAASIGIGIQADVITAFSMDLHGNAITVSNAVWEEMKPNIPTDANGRPVHPISSKALLPVVRKMRDQGKPLTFGVVFPVSTHNYELRYWLAAGGVKPGMYTPEDINGNTDGDVIISITPPPQMPATLAQGTIQGYCVGEPWNQQAVARGVGVAVVTDEQIWPGNPEKVFGVTKAWAEANPETHIAIIKALIRACKWLDASMENRKEAVRILSRPEYVGADEAVLAASMTGTFEFEKGDRRPMPDFNIFFRNNATYPYYSDCIWYLTQMRRWGQIPEPKPENWYFETAKKVYRPDIYRAAAERLIAEGHLDKSELPETDGFRPPESRFIDGVTYDGRRPLDYLKSFTIGNQE